MSLSRTIVTLSLAALTGGYFTTALAAQTSLTIEPVAEGLKAPWGVAPLPGGGLLVTEKGGRLIYQKDGERHSVSGVPEVAVVGQGDLLDITLARDFE